MSTKFIFALFTTFSVLAVVLGLVLMYSGDIAVLNPKGWIALEERDLMLIAILMMLIVVIPVFVLTIVIAWEYRASNKAEYSPDWDYSFLAEALWWGFPCAIIFVLSIITWKSSHTLDPYKPLETDAKPLTIQVVALQWKWLFIYPEQNIATVNFLQFPEQVPINFEITADAPMNSFWIPQLGGQIYAMPGMRTKLHLIANEAGSFRGCSANISGAGFSGMTFIAKASSESDFKSWVEMVKQSPSLLGKKEYEALAAPSEYNPEAFYQLHDKVLFDWVVMKPMMEITTNAKSG